MKKRILGILLSLCMVIALTPVVAIADDEPLIKISGPDKICSQQDYVFDVTAANGVTINSTFDFSPKTVDAYGSLSVDGNTGFGVLAHEWFDTGSDSFTLKVEGTTTDGKVSAEKTVQIARNHIFSSDDGVCGCGEIQTYTITYDSGEGAGSIEPGTKTHGKDFTLSSETFTREGFVQIGWTDKERVEIYPLGGIFTTNENITLYPVWKEAVTMTVPFTTTVELGGSVAPGETTFKLVALDSSGDKAALDNVDVFASITTNGAGRYSGTMTLTGTSDELLGMLSDGVFVQQVNEGKANWTYDDAVWCLKISPVAYADTDEYLPSNALVILPATYEETPNGKRYYVEDGADVVDQMTFKNIYTENAGGATEGNNSANSTKDSQDGNAIPQTGDNSFILVAVLVIAAVSSLIGVGVSVCRNRKRGLHAK